MKLPNVEKWIPNLFLILLFENGRKHGLGLWIVVMAVALFLVGLFDAERFDRYVIIGVAIFTGGNFFDKWFQKKTDVPANQPRP